MRDIAYISQCIRPKNEPIDPDIEFNFANDLLPEARSADRRWLAAEDDQRRKLVQQRILGMAWKRISSRHVIVWDRFAASVSRCLP